MDLGLRLGRGRGGDPRRRSVRGCRPALSALGRASRFLRGRHRSRARALRQPLATLALHYLSRPPAQNVARAEWAPALAVLGLSPGMALALGRRRALRLLTRRSSLSPSGWRSTAAWHVPGRLRRRAPRTPRSCSSSTPRLSRRRRALVAGFSSNPRRIRRERRLYLFGRVRSREPIGLLPLSSPRDGCRFYVDAHGSGASRLSPTKQIAGVLMAAERKPPFSSASCPLLRRFLAEEENETTGLTPGRETPRRLPEGLGRRASSRAADLLVVTPGRSVP